jgi:hypothetical protein
MLKTPLVRYTRTSVMVKVFALTQVEGDLKCLPEPSFLPFALREKGG